MCVGGRDKGLGTSNRQQHTVGLPGPEIHDTPGRSRNCRYDNEVGTLTANGADHRFRYQGTGSGENSSLANWSDTDSS